MLLLVFCVLLVYTVRASWPYVLGLMVLAWKWMQLAFLQQRYSDAMFDIVYLLFQLFRADITGRSLSEWEMNLDDN